MDTKNVGVGSKRKAAPFSLSLTLKSESFQKHILVFLFNREGLILKWESKTDQIWTTTM